MAEGSLLQQLHKRFTTGHSWTSQPGVGCFNENTFKKGHRTPEEEGPTEGTREQGQRKKRRKRKRREDALPWSRALPKR